MINILYNDLKTLIGASSLVPEEQYRITDYVTTVAKTNYTSAGYKFDIVVTALTNDTLYEYALLRANASEAYFDAEGLLIYNIKYNVNNIIPGYDNDWVDANGKGCIYYMVDNKGNEAPYDFKNIKHNGKFLFNNVLDGTDTSQTVSEYNVVKEVIEDGVFTIPLVIFNNECHNVTIDTNASQVTITESSNLQIGDNFKNSEITNVNNTTIGNEVSDATLTSIDGAEIGDNCVALEITNQTNLILGNNNNTITLGGGNGVIIDSNNTNVTIGTNAKDVYINGSKTLDLGNNIEQFNISSSYNMTVADDCKLFNLNETNHLTATTGCENINTIKNDYITLTEEVKNVTVNERLTNLILDGTKLIGTDAKVIIKQDDKVVIINEQTNSEVVLVEDGTTASNPNSFINDSPSDGLIYGRKDGDWEQIDTSGGGSVEHDDTLNKNINPDFLHINEEEKALITSTAGIVSGHTEAIEDLEYNKADTLHTHIKSEVGLANVDNTSDLTKPISTATQTALNGKADKATTLSGYGITDALTQTNILYADLLDLIANDELIPSSSYRIIDYITTTVQADTTSAGHNFDVIVTALSTNELSEDAKCIRKSDDTYFTNAKLETWEIKYCINNNAARFAWANASIGKGVIYYMKDEYNNECPYDFKNIQFLNENDVYVFTFGGTTDNSLVGNSIGNTIKESIVSNKLSLNFNTFGTNCNYNILGFNNNNNTFGSYCNSNAFGDECRFNKFGDDCFYITFGNSCRFNTLSNESGSNTFGLNCWYNTFGDGCYSNKFGDGCLSNNFSDYCSYNTFGNECSSNNFGDECTSNIFDDYCGSNTFDSECRNNTFGINCYNNTFGAECTSNTFSKGCSSNTFIESCQFNTFDSDCNYNTFSTYYFYNTFGDNCSRNNFYHGTSGTTLKDFVKYVVLEDGCNRNNFYSTLTTSGADYLQRIRIKGLDNATQTDTILTLPANIDYEWVVAKNSSGIIEQYCPEDSLISDAPSDNKTYGRKNGDWSQIDTSGGGGGVSIIPITWSDLKSLRDDGTLVPGQSYRITDYVCTTTTTDSRAINNLFDIVVTALDESHLSENASATYHAGDTYFTNAKLESWKLKYCIDNDANRFEWADTVSGKGVIYYMKDNYNNEVPYDFKNIQYLKNGVWLYTFGGEIDNSVVIYLTNYYCINNIIGVYSEPVNPILKYKLSFNTFGSGCESNTFGVNCIYNTFGNYCKWNTFGDYCSGNKLGSNFYYNMFGDNCGYNTFGNSCQYNTFGNYCTSNTLGVICHSNTFGNECGANVFGNNFRSNTLGNDCSYNKFYHGTTGATKKDYIRYVVLEDGCENNNFYLDLTTSISNFLQRIRIKGLKHPAPTPIQIESALDTNYEWVICYTSGNVLKQYCPANLAP